MDNLTIDQVRNFAIKNNVELSEEELTFTYDFVKKNWELIFRNPIIKKFKSLFNSIIKNMVIYYKYPI